jgi:hypothetical protein
VVHWLQTYVLPAVLATLVLLLVLWPTERSGRRLLVTWGVPEPRPGQVVEAVRYLRQRRLLYLVFFLLFPSLAGLTDLPGIGIYVPLLVAMLVGELVATLRPVSGVRSASLDRRSWRDLVPRWAVLVTVGGAVSTVVAGVLAGPGDAWIALVYVGASLLFVGVVVGLAVRRPAVEDAVVDAALRTRTARVAVGIGFGWLGTALVVAVEHLRLLTVAGSESAPRPAWLTDDLRDVLDVAEFVVFAVAVVCWLWVTTPSRRSLATTR